MSALAFWHNFVSAGQKHNLDYQMLKERNNFNTDQGDDTHKDFEEKVKNENETNFAKLRPNSSLAGLR